MKGLRPKMAAHLGWIDVGFTLYSTSAKVINDGPRPFSVTRSVHGQDLTTSLIGSSLSLG